MMTSEPVQCPQCQAPLTLMPDRKFFQCTYCGSKFVVTLPDGRNPRLAHFESVLGTPAGKTLLRDAQERLVDLEMTLADAEDDIETTRSELDDANSAYRQARNHLQAAVAPLQNSTYAVGLLAAVAGFAALFVFKSPQRIPGAVIGILLALTGLAWHREWQDAEVEGQAACQEARNAMVDAEVELRVATARLEDAVLESELLQKHILPGQGEQGAA